MYTQRESKLEPHMEKSPKFILNNTYSGIIKKTVLRVNHDTKEF